MSKIVGGQTTTASFVPQNVLNDDGEFAFSARNERVPIFEEIDKKENIPTNKNWFEEGLLSPAQD